MKLWTVQPVSCLEQLEQTGVYICDESRSFNLTKSNSLKPQYQWLITQMEEKIGVRPDGVSYPVWAWHTWDYERQCPNTESSAFLKRTEEKVLLTLDIPEDQVVLTDFDAWQIVMMNSYLSYDEDAEKVIDYLSTLDEEEYQKEIEKSWRAVFDTSVIHTSDVQRGRYIQATFWQIKKEYVVETKILERND